MKYKKIILFLNTLLLTLFCGCLPQWSEDPEIPSFTFHDALEGARRTHLDVNAFETVQSAAAEYKNHQRVLYLDEVISDGRGHTISPAILRSFLEDALIFNHLLGGTPPAADLVKTQSSRSGQLLDHAVAAAAVKLHRAMQLYELGDETMRQEISDSEMELRNLTGASPVDIARIDLSALPEPYALKNNLTSLQQFAAFNRPESAGSVLYPELLDDVKWTFREEKQLLLHYTRVLYGFQTKLAGRVLKQGEDCQKTVRLANAVGIALLLEADFTALNEAFNAYRLEELRFRLEKSPSAEQQKKLILLRSDWLLCWLRLRTTLGVTDFDLPMPELNEQKHPELTHESALLFEILSEMDSEIKKKTKK